MISAAPQNAAMKAAPFNKLVVKKKKTKRVNRKKV